MYEITYLNLEENQIYEKTVEKVLHKCFEEEGLFLQRRGGDGWL